jgi:hypothetical protein
VKGESKLIVKQVKGDSKLIVKQVKGDCSCRHGFYWPTALLDVVELVKTCKACQFHAKQIHMPAQTLQMIPPS